MCIVEDTGQLMVIIGARRHGFITMAEQTISFGVAV